MVASWMRERRGREKGGEERDRQAWDPVHFGQGELAEKQEKGTWKQECGRVGAGEAARQEVEGWEDHRWWDAAERDCAVKFQEDKSEMLGASGERLRLQKTWGK